MQVVLYIFVGSRQKITRPPPPPPPPSSSNDHAASPMLNPDSVAKFNRLTNQNGPPAFAPPPPPPPRGVTPNNFGGTTRGPPSSSDFIDNTPPERRHNQYSPGALVYDHDFENRFRFAPIENLPPPDPWKQPPARPSKHGS